jgi:signal transduction histidine kinase/ligand-binding sensor domain-containing protein
MNMRGRAFRLIVSATLALFSTSVFALDPTEQLSELSHTEWTAREGAPANVAAIAQTSDGTLWLGCTTGLFHFDGARFERLTLSDGTQPTTGDVSVILSGPTNELWIGLRFGGAFVLRDGQLTHYGEREGLPTHSIMRFGFQNDGTQWAQTTVGLFFLHQGYWTKADVKWNYPANEGNELYVDHGGTVWSRSAGGTYVLSPGNHSFTRTAFPGGRGQIATGPNGLPYVFDYDSGLESLGAATRRITGSDLGGDKPGMGPGLFDSDGGMWAMVTNGGKSRIVRVPDAASLILAGKSPDAREVQTLNPAQELTGNVHAFFEDEEHNIWLATTGGLDRFRANKLHAMAGSIVSRDLSMTLNQQGHVLLADERKIIVIPNPLAPPVVTEYRSQLPYNTSSILQESDGSILIGREDGYLGRLLNGQYVSIALPSQGKSRAIHGLARDVSGALWMASTGDGLYRQEGSAWTLNGGIKALPAAVPTFLLSDSYKRIWLGYQDSQLFLIEPSGRVQRFPESDGLGVGAVLAVAPKRERVWVAGSEGVSLLIQNHVLSLKSVDKTPFIGISGILEDKDGGLWLNGSDGVTHISAAEISAFQSDASHRVIKEVLNFEDGLVETAPSLRPLSTAVESSDGKLWFLTTAGVYWIDSAHIARNGAAPPVLVTAVVVDGKRMALNSGSVRTPPRTSNFEILYTANSLSMPTRVQFRYQLDGVDHGWQEAGNRRQAFYTNVPPGVHHFRVIASNEDGLWNETGASATVEIEPAFYQTRLFYALCALSTLILLWQVYLFRTRQLSRQLKERLGARLDERERIARELHDTLLQSAQGLILMVQGLAGRLHRPDPIKQEIETALDHADNLLNEARDRVNDLRTIGLDTGVEQSIVRFGADLFLNKPVSFTVTTERTPLLLNLAVADDAYRIAREALTNACVHSNAAAVTVLVSYETSVFRLLIKDNGRGIEPDIQNAGARPRHFGLLGMRERAVRLGGTLVVNSVEGSGTSVELLVPGERAYRESSRRPVWLRRFMRSGLVRMTRTHH